MNGPGERIKQLAYLKKGAWERDLYKKVQKSNPSAGNGLPELWRSIPGTGIGLAEFSDGILGAAIGLINGCNGNAGKRRWLSAS